MSDDEKNYLDTVTHIIKILAHDLYPLLTTISALVGFFLIFSGFVRLSKHGKPQTMMRHYSPISTIFYFISGVMLISIIPTFQMLESTIFQNDLAQNPILAYINNHGSSHDLQTGIALGDLMYSFAIIIGLISLIRGLVLLVKLGEGQQDGHLNRSIIHIVAGIVGLNAQWILGYFGWL